MLKKFVLILLVSFGCINGFSQSNQNKLIRYSERDRKLWLQKQQPYNSSFQQYNIPLPVNDKFYRPPVSTKKLPSLQLPKQNHSLVTEDTLPAYRAYKKKQ